MCSIGIGYVAAFGLQVVALALDGFGPDNLLAVVSDPDAAEWLARVQLVVISVVSLTGIGVLFVRRRSRGRPLRRSLVLLVNSFALGLVMIAFLFLSAAFGLVEGDPAFETIRRATLFVIGLAPFAFLVGLLQARLLRSGVGDLVVELRADPAPARAPRRAGVHPPRPVAGACLLATRLRVLRRPRRATGARCRRRRTGVPSR